MRRLGGFLRGNYRLALYLLAAALSAGLLALGFPPYSYYGLAWIALIPLLWALLRSRSGYEGALISYLWGFLYTAGTVYWLSDFAVWTVVFIAWVYGFTYAVWGVFVRNLAAEDAIWTVFGGAFGWVALEMLKQYGLWTIPLMLVSQTQVKFPVAIQIADLTGQWGGSFVVVMANLAIAYFLWGAGDYDELLRTTFAPAVILIITFTYGVIQLENFNFYEPDRPTYGETWHVALVQNGGGELTEWTPQYASESISRYVDFTRSRVPSSLGLDLVMFPEAAIPVAVPRDSPRNYVPDELFTLSSELDAPILYGTSVHERTVGESERKRRGSRGEADIPNYNGAQVITPGGMAPDTYGKNRPVPVGETQPMGPLVKLVDPQLGSQRYESFRRIEPLSTGGPEVGISICFESLYPEISRWHTKRGADLLVDLANYAWYDSPRASNFNSLVDPLRAVENRRFMLRVSTTGYSQVTSFSGVILNRNEGPEESYFLSKTVEGNSKQTLYTRYGDWFAYLSLGVFFITVLTLVRRSGRRRGEPVAFADEQRLWP